MHHARAALAAENQNAAADTVHRAVYWQDSGRGGIGTMASGNIETGNIETGNIHLQMNIEMAAEPLRSSPVVVGPDAGDHGPVTTPVHPHIGPGGRGRCEVEHVELVEHTRVLPADHHRLALQRSVASCVCVGSE